MSSELSFQKLVECCDTPGETILTIQHGVNEPRCHYSPHKCTPLTTSKYDFKVVIDNWATC